MSSSRHAADRIPPARRDPVRHAAYTRALAAHAGYRGTTLSPEQEQALRSYEGPEISGNPDRIRKR
jgi:hypothetical protein